MTTALPTTSGDTAQKGETRECANTAGFRNNMNEHIESTAADKRGAILAAQLALMSGGVL